MKIEMVVNTRPLHGECPLWSAAEDRLYWTDVFGKRLNRLDPMTGVNETWSSDMRINSFALRAEGGLVAGNWDGIALLQLKDDRVESQQVWTLPDELKGRFFMNDGRCDARGRFWVGSVCETYDSPGSALYCFTAENGMRRECDGMAASNGLAFSPDNRTMYYADSTCAVVWAFDFDLTDGKATNRRVFARLEKPDGAAMDIDGGYWVSTGFGGRIVRIAPNGCIDRSLQMPARYTTMCSFGGPGLDVLYVTTSTRHYPVDELEREICAGAVFAVTGLGTSGLPEPKFAG